LNKSLDGTGNTYLSDGKADSKIEAIWWITNANIGSESNSDGSSGCNLGFVALALACLPVFVVLSQKKRG
jgi:Synergist-CTERM protein sorting domain-containing protein